MALPHARHPSESGMIQGLKKPPVTSIWTCAMRAIRDLRRSTNRKGAACCRRMVTFCWRALAISGQTSLAQIRRKPTSSSLILCTIYCNSLFCMVMTAMCKRWNIVVTAGLYMASFHMMAWQPEGLAAAGNCAHRVGVEKCILQPANAMHGLHSICYNSAQVCQYKTQRPPAINGTH